MPSSDGTIVVGIDGARRVGQVEVGRGQRRRVDRPREDDLGPEGHADVGRAVGRCDAAERQGRRRGQRQVDRVVRHVAGRVLRRHRQRVAAGGQRRT